MIEFKNPKTGEIKTVKVGFSWTLLLFSGFFGIPLFLRKLNTWGGISLGLCFINILLSASNSHAAAAASIGPNLVSLGLSIWMGIKGNELTAKNYIESGWELRNRESDSTRYALGRWGLAT